MAIEADKVSRCLKRPMRRIVSEVQKERSFLMASHEFNRPPRQVIREIIVVDLYGFAGNVERVLEVRQVLRTAESLELLKAAFERVILVTVAAVPFSNQARGIAASVQGSDSC